ncbi:MAG: helix-turn-helix transcriptional regulator [Anaerolineae bacterium]|nr:helix-turn-helix transcriptional regulator [Anaerolineae bacterium]
MQKTNTLIRTKLHWPFTRSELVPRPRLQARITQGLHGPLTLITAPAGFGKTTLVASCVAGCDMPVAWLSLDKNDNQAGRFLSYLVTALQEADHTVGGEAAQLVAAAPQAPPEAILTSLINNLDAAGGEMALVLDDYQFISNQTIHEGMTFLLDHCPRTFHLVIASRSDPPLPLARLRARGQVIEIRAAELGFTEPETAQFLNKVMGLGLDTGAVAVLKKRTEGWIAGLQMAALALQGARSMRDREDVTGFIKGFSGTNRYILDYLLEEVLAGQPQEIRHFLLHTSILERLTAPLCDAVLADEEGFKSQSVSILEYLERANLFLVSLDDKRIWYRYHHLFADLLRARLHQAEPDRVVRLLTRAAAWCEQQGQVADAVAYALAAPDYHRAAGLIAKNWHHTVNKGEIETVWSWLEALPKDVVKSSALLNLAYCWVLWFRSRVDAIEPHLTDAENALNKQVERLGADDAAYPDLPAHLAAMRSIVARYDNNFEVAIAFAERALYLAPENLPSPDNALLRTVIFMALASAYDGAGDLEKAGDAYAETIRWSRLGANAAGVAGMTHRQIGILWLLGRLRAADEACRAALSYFEEQGMARLPVAGILHLRMSEVYLECNKLEAAEAHLARGIELGKWSGRFDAALNAAPALARLRQAQGDANGALAAAQEAEAALGESPSPLWRAELLALRARILVRQGALTEATRCIEGAARLAEQDRGLIREMVRLAGARVMLAQRNPDKAVAELTQALAAAEESGRFGAALELRILRSLAFLRRSDTPKAQADLERALALAEPEGYGRIFIDEGGPLQMLLAQWLIHAGAGPLKDYATRLLSQFDAEPQAAAPTPATGALPVSYGESLVEPLSRREVEVLQLIALGQTNQEIARQLIISPGTVKAHTASIYRKLDVANRTEAAARARQFGILP